jgi:hypothetical protein
VFGELRLRVLHDLELVLEEADVEIGVVDDEFAIGNKLEELVDDVAEINGGTRVPSGGG